MTTMTTHRWKHVKEILGSALEVEASRRESFLVDACGEDQELLDEIRGLLGAYERDPGFIESPAAIGTDLLQQGLADRLIGPYRLTGLIASGGMGTVYKAVRADDEYRRQVAIKFISTPAWTRDPGRYAELLRR